MSRGDHFVLKGYMKIQTPKFTIEYKGAEFVFKYGTERDIVEILSAQEKPSQLRIYFCSRLVEVRNLEIDGKAATPSDIMDLPSDAINEIVSAWIGATIEHRKKLIEGGDPKKKKKPRKSPKG